MIVLSERVSNKFPGALLAIIGAIAASWVLDLSSYGVAILGTVPEGLPHLSFPQIPLSDIPKILNISVACFIIILAQSAATSRAYAIKFSDTFNENLDLIGLSLANVAAGISGTFVVNGSPTKTEMVKNAGGQYPAYPAHNGLHCPDSPVVLYQAIRLFAHSCTFIDGVPYWFASYRYRRNELLFTDSDLSNLLLP